MIFHSYVSLPEGIWLAQLTWKFGWVKNGKNKHLDDLGAHGKRGENKGDDLTARCTKICFFFATKTNDCCMIENGTESKFQENLSDCNLRSSKHCLLEGAQRKWRCLVIFLCCESGIWGDINWLCATGVSSSLLGYDIISHLATIYQCIQTHCMQPKTSGSLIRYTAEAPTDPPSCRKKR